MRHARRCTTAVVLLITVVAGACTKPGDPSAASDSARTRAAMDSASATGNMPAMGNMSGMKGMEGMTGMMDSTMGGMSNEMHTHMMSMMSASGDSMKGMLPRHRQMVASMIAKMNGEMRDMKMTSDTEWSATVDSLRKDLVRMPELGNTELTTMMPAHMTRVTRLSEMHQKMMRAMGSK